MNGRVVVLPHLLGIVLATLSLHIMVRFKQKAARRASGDVVVGRPRGRSRQDPESGSSVRRKRRLRPGTFDREAIPGYLSGLLKLLMNNSSQKFYR
jgi:hypothetical protein